MATVLRNQDVNPMRQPDPTREDLQPAANVVDFEDALLDACSEAMRRDLLAEAELLAQAFAPERRRQDLRAMASTLTAGARDDEIGRVHARRLAAALRRLGQQAGDFP